MLEFSFLLDAARPTSAITVMVIDEKGLSHHLKTPLRIQADMWDQQKQCPVNIYKKKLKCLNVRLNRLRVLISSYLRSCFERKKRVACTSLSRQIKKVALDEDISYTQDGLLYFMMNYIMSRKHLITNSTYKRYMVFFRLIERYEGYLESPIMISDVSSVFVRSFLEFGRGQNYSDSTIFRTVEFIRTILNFLERRGIRTCVFDLEIPKKQGEQAMVTLSEDELIKIKRMPIPLHLKPARDWLVISCYTGQRLSDFMRFDFNTVKVVADKSCLSFTQRKTGRRLLLPIHPAVSTIMSQNDEAFPKRVPMQRYNEQIKIVARLAGINELVSVRIRKGYRSVISTVPKWQAVTSHIGRRSFASNFYGSIPTPLLMEATGHSSEQMFNRYVNSADIERIKMLGNYFEMVYRKKFQQST
ncbi:MAG: hypothetical protein BGO21_00160 [Dyadobacter sp. 50-39]|uniref:phage integrase SAM-like domain-containing protein n=1 Tax=Dyadobacter sp. 50-39 TaxID=1895756 RepID=UPI000961AAFB|nr:phage integrase SAM-like domain-containing protein [Dyadobacter sp. 50-39]OJV15155.1 MAG: hypothetical protein BGO21_00160 [Dyadobacter sp. 50-39]